LKASFLKHSSVKIVDFSTRTYNDEYGLKFFDYAGQELILISSPKDKLRLPDDCEFLCQDKEGMWFMRHLPAPRPFQLLNLALRVQLERRVTIATILDSQPIREIVDTPDFAENVEQLVNSVVNKVFKTSDEAEWWNTYMWLEIRNHFMPSAYVLELTIHNKSRIQ
jgi:hypothetical protein